MKTEKNQEINADSNIELENIYNAIRYLKPEHQGIILSTFKLTELCSIFADDERYKNYLSSLIKSATTYMNTISAIITLYKEAYKNIAERKKFNVANSMSQVYDCMTEEDKKAFCQNMFAKKEFFEDSFKVIMDSFENAVEVKDNAVNGKMNGQAEK